MKKLSLVIIAIFVLSILSSCGRKCTGGWYGKRNLSETNKIQKDKKQDPYVWASEELQVEEI